MTTPSKTRLHWNYFLALEKDLEAVSRYIEFCPDNFKTYSIELAHLLLSAASEVDTVAKCICNLVAPNESPERINEYRKVIRAAEENEATYEEWKHRITEVKVYIPRYGLEFTPWESWAKDETPEWWKSYNNVKHERNNHFKDATLGNALNAMSALLVVNYFYFRHTGLAENPNWRQYFRGKEVTRHMQPESIFLRFKSDYYDNVQAELAATVKFLSSERLKHTAQIGNLMSGM